MGLPYCEAWAKRKKKGMADVAAKFPYMDKKILYHSVSFTKISVPQHISQRATEEILADAYSIRAK